MIDKHTLAVFNGILLLLGLAPTFLHLPPPRLKALIWQESCLPGGRIPLLQVFISNLDKKLLNCDKKDKCRFWAHSLGSQCLLVTNVFCPRCHPGRLLTVFGATTNILFTTCVVWPDGRPSAVHSC